MACGLSITNTSQCGYNFDGGDESVSLGTCRLEKSLKKLLWKCTKTGNFIHLRVAGICSIVCVWRESLRESKCTVVHSSSFSLLPIVLPRAPTARLLECVKILVCGNLQKVGSTA